jgi:hypothetical protein
MPRIDQQQLARSSSRRPGAKGSSLVGPGGMPAGLTKKVLEWNGMGDFG